MSIQVTETSTANIRRQRKAIEEQYRREGGVTESNAVDYLCAHLNLVLRAAEMIDPSLVATLLCCQVPGTEDDAGTDDRADLLNALQHYDQHVDWRQGKTKPED